MTFAEMVGGPMCGYRMQLPESPPNELWLIVPTPMPIPPHTIPQKARYTLARMHEGEENAYGHRGAPYLLYVADNIMQYWKRASDDGEGSGYDGN